MHLQSGLQEDNMTCSFELIPKLCNKYNYGMVDIMHILNIIYSIWRIFFHFNIKWIIKPKD